MKPFVKTALAMSLVLKLNGSSLEGLLSEKQEVFDYQKNVMILKGANVDKQTREVKDNKCNAVRLTNDGYILTDFHCIDACTEYLGIPLPSCHVSTLDGKTYLLTDFFLVDKQHDLALIKASIHSNQPKPLISLGEDAKTGDYVQAKLFHFGTKDINGEVVFETGGLPGAVSDSFGTSIPVTHGYSGGAILDKEGRLIGLISYIDSTNQSGVNKIKYAKELIRKQLEE